MKKYLLLLSIMFLFFGTKAFGFLQCGPGGEIVGSGSGTAERLGKAGINWFTSSPSYTSATTSSTSGCDGFLAYIQAEKEIIVAKHYNSLQEEASKGIIEKNSHIGSLASLYGCQNESLLAVVMHERFQELFQKTSLKAAESKKFLNTVTILIQQHPILVKTCSFI